MRSLSALFGLLLAAALGSADAYAGVEAKATGDFVLTELRALPAAWIVDGTYSVHATGLFSAGASELADGTLLRLTFPYPNGERGGVLRLDLRGPSEGTIYGLAEADRARADYYEVDGSDVVFQSSSAEGTVEVQAWSHSGATTTRVAFSLRFEDAGPDGVAGTDDDLAREVTSGVAATSAPPKEPVVSVPLGSGGGGTAGAGGTVVWGDPWPYSDTQGATSGSEPSGCGGGDEESSGCGSDSDTGDTSDASSDSSGGCGGSDDSTSDSGSSGCSGDDDDSSACESDAQAAPRSPTPKRRGGGLPRVGNFAVFLVVLAGVLVLRRRSRPIPRSTD